MPSRAKVLGVCSLLILGTAARSLLATAQEKAPPQAIRASGPDVLNRAGRTFVLVEGLFDGKTWRALDPGNFSVKVSGNGKLLEDPSGKAMNPFEIRADDADSGRIVVEIRSGDRALTRSIALGTPKAIASIEAAISPGVTSHRFAGLGGGVLFYDNQFDIAATDEIYDWCFRDVKTSFLHVLIRPDYEKENDNDNWQVLDLARFDFKSLERPIRIIKKAKERNPEVKLYASLYSPPAWMKSNISTSGVGSLKDGLFYRQELAEYVFAYLKYMHKHGITIDYLGFFNEPDFRHEHQDGMHFADLGVLADTFIATSRSLDTLIAKDTDLKKPPAYVFPDTLGAGSITRAGPNTKRLLERAKLLDKVGVWGVHDYWKQPGNYWNERFNELRAFPGAKGKPIWMTEWAQRFRRGDLASGVEYGTQILNAVRLGAEAWMVFEWCHPGGNQSGLISTQWDAKSRRYWRSKAYHVFRQIANTTPADSTVVPMRITKSTGKALPVECLAVKHAESVIFHIMNPEPGPLTYRVKLPSKLEKASGFLTSPTSDMAEAKAQELAVRAEGNGALVSGAVPAYSLLSVVVPGIAEKKTP
jgi:hypothetical protein